MKRAIAPLDYDGITLRPLAEHDLPYTLAWRNHDDARPWFKTSDRISEEGHRGWFERYLVKEDDYTLIATTGDTRFGQCALYDIDLAAKRAEIGRFLVAPEFAGRGLMRKTWLATMQLAREAFGLTELYLEVARRNARAIHIYESAGFAKTGGDDRDYIQMVAPL